MTRRVESDSGMAPEADRLPVKPAAGLTGSEVAARRARGQTNASAVESSRSYRRLFLQNAATPINLSLFAICIGLTGLGLFGDAAMTGSLVIANVVVGLIQEIRAKRKIDSITLLTRPTATVIRDGAEQTIDPEDIVLDDVLVLQPGDQVLVDGRIVLVNGLVVDESLLTGESDLVPKRAGEPIHSGTFCMGGSGAYTAERVGANSLAQQLTAQARKFRTTQTPLQREVGLVLRVMALVAIALSVQVISSYRGDSGGMSVSESLRASAVLASLIPQGLSFMVTATYAMAVIRMAGSGALIQRINAVESTSNVNLLCLDKTGTLTTNNLVLEEVLPLGVDLAKARALLGDYCASVAAGNRTTAAIAAACPSGRRPVREEAPFSADRKWSAVAFEDGVYVLGAPEILHPSLPGGSDLKHDIERNAALGLRVVLFASAEGRPPLYSSETPVLPPRLVPLAMVTLRDELRPETKNTIAQFAKARIGMKIISGDNPETVAALAKQAGFPANIRSVSGLELDALSEAQFRRAAEEATVFGRVTPQQKQHLVRVLRRRGRHVAMIGDGVNDVLALKQADLAIALRTGSQVTRSIADIVLLDDSFGSLPRAFLEGQRVRRGMLDIIRLFLVRTLSVALVILGATLLSSDFPTTPRQNGVLAFLTVGIPTLALAAWARPAQTPRRLILSSGHFVLPAAVSIAATGLAVYQFYLSATGDVVEARTALTTTVILCGLTLIPFAQPPAKAFVAGAELNGDWRPTALAAGMLILYVCILALPEARHFYELQILSVWGYVLIAYVVFGWALALRLFWRVDLPGRAGKIWRWLVS